MAIGFIHASVRLVLGLLAVALSANAIEDRLSIPTNGACIDKHESKRDCLEWAWYGECFKNPEFMHDMCKQSCGLCIPTPEEKGECQDHHPRCTDWAEKGNLHVNNLCNGHWHREVDGRRTTGAYIVELCPAACKTCDIHLDDRDIDLGIGLPQTYDGMETDKELYNLLKSKVSEIRSYVESIKNDELREVCKMSHPHCARFALSSDCDDHADHYLMKYGCAAACQTCEKLLKEEHGIAYARSMWGTAIKDYNEKKLVKEVVGASMNQ